MHRFMALFRLAFQNSLAYRSEILIWMVLDMVPTLILFTVWAIIFRDGQVHQGYSFSQMMEYSLFLLLINAITAVHFESSRVEQIRDGKIDILLLRPVPYLYQLAVEHIGGRLFYLIIFLPIFLFVQFGMGSLYHLSFSTWTPEIFISVIVLLLFGALIEFGFGVVVVLFGFWFEYSEGLEHFKWIVITLFSGAMLPPAFLPPWLQQIVAVLPFRYMYSELIAVIQSRRTLQISDILVIGLTSLVWIAAMLKLWQLARKQYSSGGG